MSKFLSFFLTITTMLMTLTASTHKITAPKDVSDFVPAVRFLVMSDSHVETLGDKASGRIQKAMSLAYSDARRDENHNTLDAILFEGDLTDDGQKTEMYAHYAAVKSLLKDETKFLAVIPKGHDGKILGGKMVELYEKLSGNDGDYHVVIGGFHFIGISTTKEENAETSYIQSQVEWLDAQLEEATKDDPSKPVFVSTHEHVEGTVYGSLSEDGWGNDVFKATLCKYPRAVSFSGHSHYPINDPRSVWQGDFTAIGTGAIKYAEFTVDGVRKLHPKHYRQIAQCWIVEVDKDNNMRLRGFDALSGTLLCEYTLSNLGDVGARQVTPERQKENSTAPTFKNDAKIKATKIAGSVSVSVPAAQSTDKNPVFLYRFAVYDKDGNEKSSTYVVNDYWKYPCYDSVSKTVKASKGDTIKVWAENSYGKASNVLEHTV